MATVLIKEQKQLMEQINKFLINLKKEPLQNRTEDKINKKAEDLEKLWSIFEENDNNIRENDPDLTDEYFSKDVYKSTEEIYVKARDVLQDFRNVNEISLNKDKHKNDDTNSEILEIQRIQLRIKRLRKRIEEAIQALSEEQSNAFLNQITGELSKAKEELYLLLEEALLSTKLVDKEINTISDEVEEAARNANEIIKLLRRCTEKTDQATQKPPKLQPVTIPKFDGQFKKWTAFRNLFKSVIHENKSLSNVEKLRYLQTHLEGEPNRMINHLQLTNENYTAAYKLILDRYENPRKIKDMYLDMLLNLSPTSKTAASLKNLHDTIREALEGLKAINKPLGECALLTRIGIQKLDTENLRAFEEGLANPKEGPTLQDLLSFLETRQLVLEAVNEKKTVNSSKQCVLVNQQAQSENCAMCQGKHKLYECKEFGKLDTKERNSFIYKNRICKTCISHNIKNKCRSKYKCQYCGKKHHSLLHYNKDLQKQENTIQSSKVSNENISTPSQIIANHIGHKAAVLLSTALIYIKTSSGRFEPFRALIDQGSQASLITENAATLLDLPRLRSNTEISGLGANKQKNAKYKVYVEIRPHFSQKIELGLMVYVLPKLTGDLPNESISIDRNQWNNIILADPNYDIQGPIDLILGADVYSNIILQGMKIGNPTAFKTKLGWILNGPSTKESSSNVVESIDQIQTNVSITEINESMTRFWNIEEIQYNNSLNKDDIKDKIDIQRQTDGRYSMRLPFKNKEINLGNSRNQALARFRHLENSLNTHPAKKLEYHKFMKEYLDLGHMRPIHVTNPNQGYYIPHHAVWKKDNITTKLRVVFDASAKTSNGRSLNDELVVGPTIQENLTSILTRWRSYKYVFTADIEKMYRQILIDERDQQFQKILWRFSPLEPIEEFCLTTVTYGISSAPYLAIQALQQLADDELSSKNSTVKKIMKEDFYVDDLMSGAASKKEAIININKIIEITSKGGFSLRKWASNDNSLIEHLPEDLKITSLLEIDNDDSIKTLGIWWNPLEDEFTYKIKANNSKDKTKRIFLSSISRIFDPMGWIAPITVVAKIMMQKLWTLKLNWDDELPKCFQKEWIKFEENLSNLENIKIPRYLQTVDHTEVEIHGFCDASEKAYAAVAYIRVNTIQGWMTNIIGAKTRVAPLNKEQSIPRLELCAAQLLSRYIHEIKKSFKFSIQPPTYYWSDSKITLAWIKGDSNRWKSFVAHRVEEINKLTSKNNWNYVGTKFNPADIASRGINSNQIIKNELWWYGPSWLKEDWKSQIEDKEFTTTEEISQSKKIVKVYSNEFKEDFNSILCRFSSIGKCIRVICYVKRWRSKNKGFLTSCEINEASTLIIKLIQGKEFEKEIQLLKAGKTNEISNKFLQLCPFLDENNVMRVGGRLRNLQIKSLSKHPIILPSSHYFTKLLVEHAHKQTLHGGNQLTLAYIRQKYWIPNGKCLIRNIIHKCIRCHRLRAETAKQLMGNLPIERINPAPAFTNTGLDYAGPINIRVSKGRGTKSYKGFIAVFVCLATRAIHLEAVSDLTTNAFLAAYKRFTARRGYCLNIYSDNGTTFIGANNKLKKEFQKFLHTIPKSVIEAFGEKTSWHFIPPGAPHFGGIWEASVKSMKYHLKRVIGDQTLTFEELTTVLYEIEACLNSRPITPLSSDPSDLEVLTPGHFLIGRPLIANPQSDISELKCCSSRWQLLTKMTHQFWKRWSTEYLSTLQNRPKWMIREQNLKVGDLVLIKEDNLPPLKWSMGKIIEIHPGTDGMVRVVTLRGPNGSIFKRPISKLCLLPIGNIDSEKSDKCDEICSTPIKIHKSNAVRDWMRGKNVECVKQLAKETKIKIQDTPRKRRGPKIRSYIPAKILLLMTIICAFVNVSSAKTEYFQINPFSHQPGIYFEEVGKMRFQRNEWNLIIYYNLASYDEIIQQLQEMIKHLSEFCHSADAMCSSILTQCQYLMFNINTSDTVIKNSNKNHHLANQRRRKRGLINGIGYIAHELFGILDARSAEQYESEIAKLKQNQKYFVELAKNHTSITDATLKIFLENMEHVQNELRFLNDFIKEDKLKNSYTAIVLKIILTMMRIQELQDKLLNIILDTHHGKLNPILLPPAELAKELKNIRGHIPADVIIPDVVDGDLADLYNLMTIKSRVTRTNIIFSVKIPLPDVELYEIFKLIPLPISYNNKSILLTPSSDYLIINAQRDHYYPINDNELELCAETADIIHICKPHNPLYNIQSNISKCEVNLINHKEDYFNSCTMHIYSNVSKWIQLVKPNSWIYAMDNEYPIDIVCKSRVINSTVIKGQGIIQLNPGCFLKQTGLTISARNSIKSSIESNFFPLINAERVFKTMDAHKLKGFRLNALDVQSELKTLQEKINQQHVYDDSLNLTNKHDIHHYVSIYLIGGIGSIGAIFWIYFHKRNIRNIMATIDALSTHSSRAITSGSNNEESTV